MSEAALQIQTKVIGDPRLVSGAKLLEIPPVFFLGSLLHLMCKALDYAEDGDMWRGDEESSRRFISALAAWPGDAALFVSALKEEGWLDGWMIADWLLYAGEYLYRKYKTGNRDRLVEIHAKNGREYGKKRGRSIPALLNAPEKEGSLITMKLPKREADGVETENDGERRPHRIIRAGENDFRDICPETLLEQGIAVSLDQLDCSALTYLDVFTAFKPVFVFHSIATLNSFYYRCTRCKSTPAWWTMVYMDKVHAVYRTRREGQAWLEDGADPVALTMAALLPSYGRRHSPTEAARQLFLEIMIDSQRQKDGHPSRWKGCVSGNFITHELDIRKGKAGKIA